MGSGEYREHRAIVGETPNLAARLQEQAAPDTVVISPATYRLVAGLFECEDLGQRTVKGISSPSLLYRVVRESEAQSRFEVAVKTGLTPLVGREHELGLLRERWQDARQGKGQVVLLSGEPGIGKSRLVQTLGQQALAEGATRIEFRCSPYHQNSAFHPIIDHLQRLMGFQRDEPAESKLDKLRRMLSTYRFTEPDTLALMASLLSLPQPANARSAHPESTEAEGGNSSGLGRVDHRRGGKGARLLHLGGFALGRSFKSGRFATAARSGARYATARRADFSSAVSTSLATALTYHPVHAHSPWKARGGDDGGADDRGVSRCPSR